MNSPGSNCVPHRDAAKMPPASTWPRGLQFGLAFLLGGLALLLTQYLWQRNASGRPTTVVEPAIYLVDLNQAGREELMQLPGIGESLADRIVQYRQTRTAFARVDDLQEVSGVGPVLLDRLRKRVTVTPHADEIATRSLPSTGREARTSSRKNPPAQPIDLNRASQAELMLLPGIGPKLAERILADRTQRGPYRAVSDITRVKGIKGKTLEKIQPYVYVEGEKGSSVARRNPRD